MRVCIFCGSKSGADPVYAKDTKKLVELLIATNSKIVYGGGTEGLMGVIRDTVKIKNGELIGVIPNFLLSEERKLNTHEDFLHIVENLAERKAFMLENSDAFVALPGGIGTIDEFCEVLALKKLNLISSPLALLNTNGFYDTFVIFLKDMVKKNFFSAHSCNQIIIENTPEALVLALKNSRLTVS